MRTSALGWVAAMERIEIRSYCATDCEDVVELWRAVFPDAAPHNEPALVIEDKQAVQPDLFLVARDGESLMGTCMGGFDGHRGWVYLVAVWPKFRRRGIATRLIRELEGRLGELGCGKVNLQVRDTSPGAIQFYERLGFTVEKRTSMGKMLEG
jgi:ribosomal protein S18 acetylase RimI-like enzyme